MQLKRTLIASASIGMLSMLTPAQAADAAPLIINELMQSNIDCIMDNLNEFPDSWVELYNNSDETVSLQGYAIGVKNKFSKAYSLPGKIQVEPHGHVIIYCDKAEGGLHTSFRLESTKAGDIYLFKDEKIVDSLEGIPAQPSPNIAYGRSVDGTGEWGYMLTPTPGAANAGGLAEGVLGSPVFSKNGGVCSDPFTLSLSLPEGAPENAVIRYTLDGSEPKSDSEIYSQPIAIDSSKAVRAKLFAPNMVSPRSLTQSYIFHPRATDLAIISIAGDNAYFYDDIIGIMSDNTDFDGKPNLEHDWRRPVNVEIFADGAPEAVINQLIETRLKGETTRFYPLKSLVLYANKRFGEKRLNYEFFPELRPGSTDFASVELRNGGNDSHKLYMRDALTQRLMGENCDIDWSAWRPAVVYINGEYYGMLNIRERQNEDNIATHYDGLEDLDLIENWNILKEGSMDNFNAFRDFYNEEGHSLDEYREWMDVEEYINHTILYTFFNNVDYPGNNVIMWRPLADGGKWRWIAKDMDLGIGYYSDLVPEWDIFDFLYNPEKYPDRNWAVTPESMVLMKKLFSIPEFRQMYIDRMAVYAGDFLTSENMIGVLNEMADIIREEVIVSQKKNSPEWANFDDNREYAIDWLKKRHDFFYPYLAKHFELGDPVALTVNKEDALDLQLTMNGIKLTGKSFDGKYFTGSDLNIECSTTDTPVTEWLLTVTDKSGNVTSNTVTSESLKITMPEAMSVAIQPKRLGSGVDNIIAKGEDGSFDYSKPFEVFDFAGRKLGDSSLQSLSAGIYILRQGNVSVKYIKK